MKKEKKCTICKMPIHHPQVLYCKRCGKVVGRVDTRRKHDREARIKALRKSWDGEAFRCNYTGIKLVEDNHRDPRYITFDHRTPRREDDIVIVAQAINDMKSDMSDKEFRRMVLQLANRFSGGEFNPKAFNLKYWTR
ncbi:hypothetical protein ES703_58931 [subsurface metagenome]